jgi:hypothetical protein
MEPYPIEINNPHPVLEFETLPAKNDPRNFPLWDRYLTVHGQRVFDLGVTCGTCSFIYSRLKEPATLSPDELASLLHDGLQAIDEELIETVKKILPSGNYRIGLITIVPEYFLPARDKPGYVGYGDVKMPFYRAGKDRVDEHGEIQQAVVPLFSPKSLKKNTVEEYKKRLQDGKKPAALAVSIAEGKHFMSGSGYESPDCISLMHFLIDGHHKVYAASQTGKPITLLSFLYDYAGAGLITTHEHNPPMMDVLFKRYYSN